MLYGMYDKRHGPQHIVNLVLILFTLQLYLKVHLHNVYSIYYGYVLETIN